ncbi:MAG: hypothetical protein ACP5NQ_07315 [Vulcanisaeta sp.]
MEEKVIIITAEWDYSKDDLTTLCLRLHELKINCEIMNYDDPSIIWFVIKHGISDGIIKIPQIFVVINGKIKRIMYGMSKDLHLEIMNIVNEILKVITPD